MRTYLVERLRPPANVYTVLGRVDALDIQGAVRAGADAWQHGDRARVSILDVRIEAVRLGDGTWQVLSKQQSPP